VIYETPGVASHPLAAHPRVPTTVRNAISNAIIHLYKTQVCRLAEYLKIPKIFLDKPPSAGLWSHQTDEQELGFSYQLADPVLYLYFEKNMSSTKILQALKKETLTKTEISKDLVNKILAVAQKNLFKQEVPYFL
jgi:NAD+ synthase